jgi:HlyD family secretion protein
MMRFPIKTTIALVVLGGAGAAAYAPAKQFLKERYRVQYQEEEVTTGPVVFEINSTGTVQPVTSYHVGSFVSGPIAELHVEFNQDVKKGYLLAKVDPLIYQSNVDRDEAGLVTRIADVERVRALLRQAENDLERAEALREKNADFVSETEMDQFKFNYKSLKAQRQLAKAAVKQAKASLEYSKAQLGYCNITAPVDGVVIDRKIDEGQTLAAQFQTPELFIIADIKQKIYVIATVDEADIGLIRQAQKRQVEEKKDDTAKFTVDAYPDDLFTGTIHEVRMNSTTTQNVVTYPVVVKVEPNPDMKLMPGMTANISFQIAERTSALRVPNSALRFFPKPEQVRVEDRPLLEGQTTPTQRETEKKQTTDPIPSAREKAAANKKRTQRHVWVAEGEFLRAVEVVIGINDNKFTEIVSGNLKAGSKVVTGVGVKAQGQNQAQVTVEASP